MCSVSLAYLLPFFLLMSPFLFHVSSFYYTCDANDLNTLQKLKVAFNNHPALTNWNPDLSCYSYYGVVYDDTGKVSGLSFSFFDLNASIPELIGDLSNLVSLDFQELSLLHGPLPKSIGKLSMLKRLVITKTGVSGSIPAAYGNLKNLTTLVLSSNNLTGDVPSSLGKINPDVIDLSHNKLTGKASFLLGVSKLASRIDLSYNKLSFDMSKLRFSMNLNYLDLSNNAIRKGISKQITTAIRLKTLNLTYNRLCGRIPVGGIMARFNASSYVHNKCLCGSPLPPCH